MGGVQNLLGGFPIEVGRFEGQAHADALGAVDFLFLEPRLDQVLIGDVGRLLAIGAEAARKAENAVRQVLKQADTAARIDSLADAYKGARGGRAEMLKRDFELTNAYQAALRKDAQGGLMSLIEAAGDKEGAGLGRRVGPLTDPVVREAFLASISEYLYVDPDAHVERVTRVLAACRASFAHTIVDCEHAFGARTVAALDSADAIIMLIRFRHWPDEAMKHFHDAVQRGVPIVGLRTALGQAWMAVVAAELSGVSGLGSRMMQASSLLATDIVVVYMLTMAALYGIMDAGFMALQGKLLKWKP